MRYGFKFRHSPEKPMGLVGKIFLTLFMVVWAGLPASLLIGEFPKAVGGLKAYGWSKTPCTILWSEANPHGSFFDLSVRFAYSFDGEAFESSRFDYFNDTRRFSDVADRAPLLEKYGKGKDCVCFVNPGNPSEAMLEKPGFGEWFTVLFPLLFVSVGIVVLYNTWRVKKPKESDQSSPSATSDGPRKTENRPTGQLMSLLIGGLFLGIGIFIACLFGGKLIAAAGAWESTEGTVISSSVRVHRGKNGSTSSPYVAYSYVVDGRTYENDDFSTISFSTSGRNDCAEAARYRPGDKTTVYYKPDNPAKSVLNVRTSPFDYVILIFPLIFVVLGGVVFFSTLRRISGAKVKDGVEYAAVADLKLRRSMGDLGGKIFFAILWNLFCLMFITIWFGASGDFSWTRKFWTFDKFFVLVFPLVGVGLIVSCLVTAFRRLMIGGHYEVTLSADRLHPGSHVHVVYEFTGNPERIPGVSFTVIQRDMAVRTSSRGGVENSEDEVWSSADPLQAAGGSFSFTLPDAIDSPRIDWSLKVSYGKLSDTFILQVAKPE